MLEAIRNLGLLNGSLLGLDRLLVKLFAGRVRVRKYYFVAQPVSNTPWLPAHRGASVEVRPIAANEETLTAFPRPAAIYPYRFEQNAVCLGAFKSESCLGFLWFTVGPYQEDEVRCRYEPLPAGAAAWDFDLYVRPEHRTSLAFLRLWDEANRVLRERGVRWSLSRISAFSRRSMDSHSRMAAKRIGTAVFLTAGAWQMSFATVPPYFFVSRDPRSYPVFALHP